MCPPMPAHTHTQAKNANFSRSSAKNHSGPAFLPPCSLLIARTISFRMAAILGQLTSPFRSNLDSPLKRLSPNHESCTFVNFIQSFDFSTLLLQCPGPGFAHENYRTPRLRSQSSQSAQFDLASKSSSEPLQTESGSNTELTCIVVTLHDIKNALNFFVNFPACRQEEAHSLGANWHPYMCCHCSCQGSGGQLRHHAGPQTRRSQCQHSTQLS